MLGNTRKKNRIYSHTHTVTLIHIHRPTERDLTGAVPLCSRISRCPCDAPDARRRCAGCAREDGTHHSGLVRCELSAVFLLKAPWSLM
ncbi:hypothetical protein QQF64_000512 [Cirrhinus molitorella]|uniref:Uncharacterized protein n=1 Tax=Cirrhinus molitorella TaxID=172907 RepID=A0ABR3NXQ8_9TELE